MSASQKWCFVVLSLCSLLAAANFAPVTRKERIAKQLSVVGATGSLAFLDRAVRLETGMPPSGDDDSEEWETEEEGTDEEAGPVGRKTHPIKPQETAHKCQRTAAAKDAGTAIATSSSIIGTR